MNVPLQITGEGNALQVLVTGDCLQKVSGKFILCTGFLPGEVKDMLHLSGLKDIIHLSSHFSRLLDLVEEAHSQLATLLVCITCKKNPIITNSTLHGHQLQHVNSVKYLGLTVSNDLRWDKHVDRVVAKANNTLSFLRCNLNIHNPKVKAHACKSLVRPLLEYSSSIWDPHTDHLTKKTRDGPMSCSKIYSQ